jgi:hypothetical protein
MPDTSDERLRNTFFSVVGQSISTWSAMESVLIGIAGTLLDLTGSRSLSKVGLVFYSVQNFHVWLNIIDELFSLDDDFKDKRDEWGKKSDQLRKLNDTRVRLAHHTYWHKVPNSADPSLAPARFDARNKSKKHAPLNMEQIADFLVVTTRIYEELIVLFEEMHERVIAAQRERAERLARRAD